MKDACLLDAWHVETEAVLANWQRGQVRAQRMYELGNYYISVELDVECG
jgi:hypothetical protein